MSAQLVKRERMGVMGHIPLIFERLVDDAAVFPPAELALDVALEAHGHHRTSWYAPFVGPLLCPASRLDDLDDMSGDLAEPLGVTIVVDTGTGGLMDAVDSVAHSERLALRGLEIPLRGEPLGDAARRTVAGLDAALGGPDDDEPAYVEVPRAHGWAQALDVISESGYRAKLRTGGPDPADHPSADELAAFVLTCLDRGIAFKFTAGLHHAVRHTVPTDGRNGPAGAVEHGFLNTLLAVATALDGGDQDAVANVLLIEDPDQLVAMVRALPDNRTTSLRRWYGSYGSCSVADPLADLIALKLISPPDPAA